MSLTDYESQWKSIMEDNMFSEDAVITDYEAITFSVKGVFMSGSYSEDSPAAYAPQRLVDREYFRMPSAEVPSDISEPWKTLEGMTLILTDRGLSFRISEVSGKRSGELTLSLQEVSADV